MSYFVCYTLTKITKLIVLNNINVINLNYALESSGGTSNLTLTKTKGDRYYFEDSITNSRYFFAMNHGSYYNLSVFTARKVITHKITEQFEDTTLKNRDIANANSV